MLQRLSVDAAEAFILPPGERGILVCTGYPAGEVKVFAPSGTVTFWEMGEACQYALTLRGRDPVLVVDQDGFIRLRFT